MRRDLLRKYHMTPELTSLPPPFLSKKCSTDIAAVMPYVAIEDHFPDYPKIRMATFALYMGLIPGALLWGMTADVIGRR